MLVLKKKWRALKKIVWRHACFKKKKKWRAVQTSGILSIFAPHTLFLIPVSIQDCLHKIRIMEGQTYKILANSNKNLYFEK